MENITIYKIPIESKKNELYHHGILGQKWGVRRFQNKDGSLTEAGKHRYDKKYAKSPNDKHIKKALSEIEVELKPLAKEVSDASKKIEALYKQYNKSPNTIEYRCIGGFIAEANIYKTDIYQKRMRHIADCMKASQAGGNIEDSIGFSTFLKETGKYDKASSISKKGLDLGIEYTKQFKKSSEKYFSDKRVINSIGYDAGSALSDKYLYKVKPVSDKQISWAKDIVSKFDVKNKGVKYIPLAVKNAGLENVRLCDMTDSDWRKLHNESRKLG